MYAKRQQELIGYIECCIGFGLVVAPLLGSLLYSAGGITVPFYTFAAIFLVVAVSVFKIIPDKADFMVQVNMDDIPHDQKEIGYIQLLSNRKLVAAAIYNSTDCFTADDTSMEDFSALLDLGTGLPLLLIYSTKAKDVRN